MINVNSIINLNFPRIKQLTQAQSQALEQTAEALHTEVVQAQVFPRDTGAVRNVFLNQPVLSEKRCIRIWKRSLLLCRGMTVLDI